MNLKEQKPGSSKFAPIHLGFNLAVGMGMFTFLGYQIDIQRGEGDNFTLLGILLGLFYGAYEIWKVSRQ